MSVYYIVFIILFCADTLFGFFFKSKLTVEKQRRAFCFVAFVLLFLLFALRHQSMGIDLGYFGNKMGYLKSFDLLNTYSWNDILEMKGWLNYEKGYIILNKVIGSIYNNRQFFLGVVAFISLAPVLDYIRRKSTLPFLSVVIFMGLPIFLMYYSGLRQIIAVSITLISFKFIEEKKPIKFILMVLFANLFHDTAFLFLIAYPLYYLKLNDVVKMCSVILIAIVFFFREPIFSIFSKLIKEDAQVEKTGAYTLFVVFFLIYIYLVVKNKKCDSCQNGMINMFYLACLCQAMGPVNQGVLRVGYYFMPYLMIAIPNTITKDKDRQEYQVNYVLVLLAFVVYGIYAIRTSSWAMAYPYYFFWE